MLIAICYCRTGSHTFKNSGVIMFKKYIHVWTLVHFKPVQHGKCHTVAFKYQKKKKKSSNSATARANAPWWRGGLWSISNLNTGSHCLQSCSEAMRDHAYQHVWRVTPALFTRSKWEHLHLKTRQTAHMVQWLYQFLWRQSRPNKVRDSGRQEQPPTTSS